MPKDDIQFGGAWDPEDPRDIPFEAFIGEGDSDYPDVYSVFDEVGGTLDKDNQVQTLACGGYGTSFYASVLNWFETGQYLRFSKRWFYAWTALDGGGSITRDNILRLVNNGAAPEDKFTTAPVTEEHLRSKEGVTPQLEALAMKYKGKLATVLNDRTNMDLFKLAIWKGKGVVAGCNLSKGWYEKPCRPPREGEKIAGHIWYAFGYGGTYPNDYIRVWDSDGRGEKKVYRNYFEAGMIHSAWTVIDQPNEGEIMDYWAQANDTLSKFTGKENNDPDARTLADAWARGDGAKSKEIINKYRTQYPLGGSSDLKQKAVAIAEKAKNDIQAL